MKNNMTIFDNRMLNEDMPIYPNECDFFIYATEEGDCSVATDSETDYTVFITSRKEKDNDDIRDIAHPDFEYLLGNSCENSFEPYPQEYIDSCPKPYLLALDNAEKARKWLKFIGMQEI